MKRVLITLILIGTLAGSTVWGVFAQEPTGESAAQSTEEAATEEPTATTAPTEEPTATTAPTEEPTATTAPTEEPTATTAPTEEPTATTAPTEEPTATTAPTEEPTATTAPTETPTVEATATVTATIEPTATVTATIEPTATLTGTIEPTATVTATETITATPTVTTTATVTATATITTEDVGAQAVVGTWSSEYIGIQNLGTSAANAALTLYDSTGSTAGTVSKDGIYVDGNAIVTTSDTGFPSSGRYAGVVSADQPVAAAAINANYTYKVADAYLGFGTVTTQNTLPLVFRGHSSWWSKFYIQNASGSEQTATLDLYYHGETSPRVSTQYTIPANASTTVDLSDTSFAAFGSGTGAWGYAVVTGGSGNVASVCESIKDPGTGVNYTVEQMYDGLASTSAGRYLVLPTVFNGHSSWNSAVNYVNVGGSATTLTFTYTVAASYGGGVFVTTRTAAAYEMGSINLPEVSGWTKPSYGSMVVSSSASDVIIVATHNKYISTGSVGYLGPAMNPDLATAKIAVPLGLNLSGGWVTSINVYSVGSGTIQTTFVRTGVDPAVSGNSYTYTSTGSNGKSTAFLTSELSGMPTNFTGAAYVEAQGSSQKILAFVTYTRYANGVAADLPGYNYE